MIKRNSEFFLLSTQNTSLLLRVNEVKKITCEYYGSRLFSLDEAPSLTKKALNGTGCALAYDEARPALSLDLMSLEFSTAGRGDFSSPSLVLESHRGSVFDFQYDSAEIHSPKEISFFPTPHGAKEELVISLRDKAMGVVLLLHYLIYEEEDVIGRYIEIRNEADEPLLIRKAASLELAVPNRHYLLTTLFGSWANENNVETEKIRHGVFTNGSLTGSSSNRHNPFFLLSEEGPVSYQGMAYGFNFVYSGSYEENVELGTFGNLRITIGISSLGLAKTLAKDDRFVTPLAIMAFSDKGAHGVSHSMGHFVNDCVIPSQWKNRDRPIIYNNWEATYFSFSKAKLFRLMAAASSLGAELFVLDDGWFGTRDNDTKGLGDWEVNLKKIPGGLSSLATYAKKCGLRFGIWMEPEMVNEDSNLYRSHPDWIIKDGAHKPIKGRHQFMLDLRLPEVQTFVFDAVDNVLSSADISYLKWDYNRPMSDFPDLPGNFFLDYMIGLYSVLRRLTAKYPDVLFENCASGGNRFDLGMLSFFPQTWLSDDTDSHERIHIQAGASLGYPLSTMSNHVSAKTSNQMLRATSLDAKFDVAAFGILGYELDLADLTPLDKKIIKTQIVFYKRNRHLLQWGDFYLLSTFKERSKEEWEAKLDEQAIVGQFEELQAPAEEEGHLRAYGFLDDNLYRFSSRPETISLLKFGHLVNFIAPIHIKEEGALITYLSHHRGMASESTSGIVSGSALRTLGAYLPEEWMGTGYATGTRLLGDFGGRLYEIKAFQEKK